MGIRIVLSMRNEHWISIIDQVRANWGNMCMGQAAQLTPYSQSGIANQVSGWERQSCCNTYISQVESAAVPVHDNVSVLWRRIEMHHEQLLERWSWRRPVRLLGP